MTPTLPNLIHEFDDSLTRVDGEKDVQKCILERAHRELKVDQTAFRIAALAYHKDKLSQTLEQLHAQSDVLEGLIETMANKPD